MSAVRLHTSLPVSRIKYLRQQLHELAYLPNPQHGSVTKMDLRTGGLLAKHTNRKGGSYESVFPIGFYTNFGGYLARNLSILNELKQQG